MSRLTLRTGTNPAAGAQLAQVISPLASCRVQTLNVSLVTDATSATRTVTFNITTSGGVVLWTRVSPATQTASLTRNYYFYSGLVTEDTSFTGTDIKLAIPSNRWPRGAILTTTIANGVAGDNLGAPVLFVEEYEG